MCLSTVYIREDKKESVVIEEASRVEATIDGNVMMETLFGERKSLKGYIITEVNFLKNYLILQRKEQTDARS
ncbi:MAG: CooT family nickel-binding protein [Spirochaetota bacterium]